jgi:hypothetical protein
MSRIHGIDTDELLARGVHALARSGEEHWAAGHFGAALLSGRWLLTEGALPEPARARLAARLRDSVAGDPARYALPEPGQVVGAGALVASLEDGIDDLCNSAHGTIFVAAALRAFHERPELATEPIVLGISALHRNTQGPDPARYFGIDDINQVTIEAEPCPSAPIDAGALLLKSLREFEVVYGDRTIDGHPYYFAGEKLHLVTHAHALWQLDALGYGALARRGRAAHHRQLRLTRQIPPEPRTALPRIASGPDDPDWWRARTDPWHDLKFAHALLELLTVLSEEARSEAQGRLPFAWGAVEGSWKG